MKYHPQALSIFSAILALILAFLAPYAVPALYFLYLLYMTGKDYIAFISTKETTSSSQKLLALEAEMKQMNNLLNYKKLNQ
jgi:hypothetical protein